MMNIIKTYIKQLYGDYLYYRYKKLYDKDPRLAAQALFKKIYGSKAEMDLDHPKSLIEKITWLELNTDTSLWTLCADKYRMREYVQQCGLQNFLPKHYGHWANPDDIDFSQLPNEFVLKANNGCGTVKIVQDKGKLDERKVKKELKRWLKRPFGYMGAQKHYLSIEPCILAEELLHQDAEQQTFSPESLVDYKVWCINGKAENVLVVYDRNDTGYALDLYDTLWNRLEDTLKPNGHFRFNKESLPKPDCLDAMLQMAEKIARPFPQVRVDFYISNGKPKVGELTLSTGYGYFTDEYYDYLGGKIDLTKTN